MQEHEGDFPEGAKEMAAALRRLKDASAEWEREKAALRMDYLLRGICEAEVDGLVEERAPLPLPLLWDHAKTSSERLAEALHYQGEITAGPEWLPFLSSLAFMIDQQ